jgi:hypothetical protein
MQQLVIIGEIGYKSTKQPLIMCMTALKVGVIIPFGCGLLCNYGNVMAEIHIYVVFSYLGKQAIIR